MEDDRKVKVRSFEDLEVWQDSRLLVKEVYKPFSALKDFGFKDQVTRASVSVMNNIADVHERESKKELARFLKIAKGSCGEVRSMILIANDLTYIEDQQKNFLIGQCYLVSRQLAGFIKYLSTKYD